MTELDLKQIREDAETALKPYEKINLISESDARAINKHVANVTAKNTLALLDRLEKAERELDEADFKKSVQISIELNMKVMERDAQLKVCVEHLKRIKANHKIHNSDDYIHTIFLDDVNEALEKVGVVDG